MVERFLRFPGGKAKALTFSYDDGVQEDIRLVEIFRKNGMRATFNLNSGMFGHDNGRHPRLTAEDALKLYTEDVCEVACHAANHAFLSVCEPVIACTEIINDRINLENMFNKQIHGFAYPYGGYSDDVVNILKNTGIYYARTIESTLKFNMPADWHRLPATCHHKNPELMNLADRFLNLKPGHDPKLFYVWGHAYEFADKDNWNVIEDFCEKMANKDDIWYATNIEIYTAWLDYQRLECTADGTHIFNPNIRSVWIGDKKGNTYEIQPGETLVL